LRATIGRPYEFERGSLQKAILQTKALLFYGNILRADYFCNIFYAKIGCFCLCYARVMSKEAAF